MDLRINIGSSLNPVEECVSANQTPREILVELQIPFMDGNVALNGRVLGTAELNQTMSELEVTDGDFLTVTSKQNSGNKKGH